jgi:hypothetical protein
MQTVDIRAINAAKSIGSLPHDRPMGPTLAQSDGVVEPNSIKWTDVFANHRDRDCLIGHSGEGLHARDAKAPSALPDQSSHRRERGRWCGVESQNRAQDDRRGKWLDRPARWPSYRDVSHFLSSKIFNPPIFLRPEIFQP